MVDVGLALAVMGGLQVHQGPSCIRIINLVLLHYLLLDFNLNFFIKN